VATVHGVKWWAKEDRLSTEETRSIGRRIVEELDRRSLQGVTDIATPDAKWHGFMSPGPIGTEAHRGIVSAWLAAVPDPRFALDSLVVDGNKAAIGHTSPGTDRGEFAGIPAIGCTVTAPAIFLIRPKSGG